MTSISIEVKPAILYWVLNKIQNNPVDEKTIDLLKSWISGTKDPTFNQIEKVSIKTSIPFGYFFLDNPPKDKCKLVEYRTVNSIATDNPSRELIDTVDDMQAVQNWMIEYNQRLGEDTYSYVGRFHNKHVNPKTIAQDILKELHLNIDWYRQSQTAADSFKILRSRISNIGVIVVVNGTVRNNTHRVLDANEFRAFTLINKNSSLIFINGRDTDNAKLFSLLHELAHIWLGESSLFNETYNELQNVNPLEQKCNAIAAELLVPKVNSRNSG